MTENQTRVYSSRGGCSYDSAIWAAKDHPFKVISSQRRRGHQNDWVLIGRFSWHVERADLFFSNWSPTCFTMINWFHDELCEITSVIVEARESTGRLRWFKLLSLKSSTNFCTKSIAHLKVITRAIIDVTKISNSFIQRILLIVSSINAVTI